MPQDQLRNAIDGLRARLQQELDAQLTSLTEQQDQAVEAARRAAEADAEERWTAKVEEVRSEWIARLESELSSARADAERRFLAEVSRLRTESEQAAADAATQARAQAEQAAAQAASRARKEAEDAAARAAANAQVQAERATADAVARVRAEAEQTATELTARMRAEAEEAAAQVTARLRTEIDQAVALTASRVREEADQEVEAERQRTVALLDAERARSQSDLDAERKRVSTMLDAERQRFDAERLQFRSERQRFESERQQFALERQRFETTAKEYETALHRPAVPDDSIGRLEAELATERQRLAEVNEALHRATESLQRVEGALEEERQARAEEQAVHAEAMAAADEERTHSRAGVQGGSAAGVAPATLERVLAAMAAMDRARSLTEILDQLVQAAGTEAPRAALFIASGSQLQGLKARGFDAMDIGSVSVPVDGPGLLGVALKRSEPVTASQAQGLAAPEFARTAQGGTAIAVPLAVGGEPVAVLYADAASHDEGADHSGWPEAVQILARHASSCLAHLTAARTAQALRLSAGTSRGEDDSSAKRYARLLVSEIKLYNEAAVRAGREHRDLLDRLRPEIERARKLYEERVSTAATNQTHFQQELVHTLADGDAALLGEPA